MKREIKAVLTCAMFSVCASAGEISPAEFQRLFDSVRPPVVEKWQTIPWMTDLLAARDRSAKEGKPLFMWSMNGNPLGCT